jgi:hypothetical protein
MSPDQVIELTNLWRRYSVFGQYVPASVVLAEENWMRYVQAMAVALPDEENMTIPSELDVQWAWPEGVAIVFSEPFEVEHTIVSRTEQGIHVPTEPHYEKQLAAGVVFAPPRFGLPRDPEGRPLNVSAYPLIWVGVDLNDITTTHWVPGTILTAHPVEQGKISQSSRLMVSFVTALGHRLTRVEEPAFAHRGERRRVKRELPDLRVLMLGSGASVSSSEEHHVEWTKRWMVRGHWRLQPYGPRRSLRKPRWIDPYVKGPEGLPLDVRPTIWKAEA